MTLVVDASAFADVIGRSPKALAVIDVLATDPHWAVPEHLRLEVVSALRGRLLGGHLSAEEFREAVSEVSRAELDVHATGPLLSRIVDLSPNANPYDAAYVALAEHLQVPLITTDAKLARIPGVGCEVRVIS